MRTPRGAESAPPRAGFSRPPKNSDTTVNSRKGPVCTDEMRHFVVPTLPVFQNLPCLVVFVSAGVLSLGPSRLRWRRRGLCRAPLVLAAPRGPDLQSRSPQWPQPGAQGDRIIDRQLSRPLFPLTLCPFVTVASDLWSQGHFLHVISALCKKAGQGGLFTGEKKKMTYQRKSPQYFWKKKKKKKYFYVKTILKSYKWPSDRESFVWFHIFEKCQEDTDRVRGVARWPRALRLRGRGWARRAWTGRMLSVGTNRTGDGSQDARTRVPLWPCR